MLTRTSVELLTKAAGTGRTKGRTMNKLAEREELRYMRVEMYVGIETSAWATSGVPELKTECDVSNWK